MSKNPLLSGLLVVILLLSMSFFANVHASIVDGWQIENGGGTYSESNGILTLSGGSGNKNIFFYKQVAPVTDFSFSLQVKATTIMGFQINVRSSLPIASVNGVNFEFDLKPDGSFLLARWTNSWTWNIFASAQANVWYTMKITVQQSPFKITAEAFDESGNSLGSNSVSDMTNLSFGSIKYIAFGVWESGTYSVRNICSSLEQPVVAWSKTYSGATAVDGWPYFVIKTGDGGYAIAGRTAISGPGSFAFRLIKTDSAGNIQWDKTYDGPSLLLNVIQTKDGGFALVGSADSYNTAWIIKTDANGCIQWSKTYGGGSLDLPFSIIETDDGYAFAGYTKSYGAGGWDMWLVKIDITGNLQWSKTFGGSPGTTRGDDGARCLIQTSDGGYLLAGDTWSFAARLADFWIVKTDACGTEQWSKTYDGKGWDGATSVVQTCDGGYAVAGFTAYGELGPNEDFWLVRTDMNGNQLWNKMYGGTNDEFVNGNTMVQTNDGGFALVGRTNSFGAGGNDFWLVKTDSIGSTLWSKTFGGTGDDEGHSLVQTKDGGYALVGYTNSFSGDGSFEVWLIKLTPLSSFNLQQVIPEVPFGAVVGVISMFVALAGFVGFKRFRHGFRF